MQLDCQTSLKPPPPTNTTTTTIDKQPLSPSGMPLENGKQSVMMACAPDRPSSVLWQLDSIVTDCDDESDLADRPRQMGFTCGGTGNSVCVWGERG